MIPILQAQVCWKERGKQFRLEEADVIRSSQFTNVRYESMYRVKKRGIFVIVDT